MADENLKLENLLDSTKIPDETDSILKVVIICAGVMGQGIAQTVASAGLEVLIVELNNKSLKEAKNSPSEFIDNEITD